MGVELIKSMTYRNNKVYTRQCSSNVTPRLFYSMERVGLSNMYQKLGEHEFEKWFYIHSLMQGNYKIAEGSNKILKRLSYIVSLLYSDKKYIQLCNQNDKAYEKLIQAKTEQEKKLASKEHQKTKEAMENYMSDFYDDHIARIKSYTLERSR